jgi:hypothetical protein
MLNELSKKMVCRAIVGRLANATQQKGSVDQKKPFFDGFTSSGLGVNFF